MTTSLLFTCPNPSCPCSINEFTNNDAVLAHFRISEICETFISTETLTQRVLELCPLVVSTVVAAPINQSIATNCEHQQATLYVKLGGTLVAVDVNIPLIHDNNDTRQSDQIIGCYR